jgi:hypothetical protein
VIIFHLVIRRVLAVSVCLSLHLPAVAADPEPTSTSTASVTVESAVSTDTVAASTTTSSEAPLISTTTTGMGRPIRAIHLTASAAGSKKYRKNHLEPMFANTVINAVVVDIKEEDGWVFIPGVKMVEEAKAFSNAIPDLESWLAELKSRGIYTAARLVAFKDNKAPRQFKNMGVKTANGDLWQDRKGITWLDPYNQQAWRYDLLIALQAAKLGFEEIQFDYIRFPTDGNIKSAHYVKPYSIDAASKALVDFLRQATQLLRPLGTKVSIDVFGLTTSVNSGMGIGQRMTAMTAEVDFVCPMTYPSHYARGEYGIPNPNDEPYRTIHIAMRDALKALGPGNAHKLRPYYQDFSLKGRGVRYGPDEVRAQIQAGVDLGVTNWTLWNASCKYTVSALRSPFEPKPIATHLLGRTKRPAGMGGGTKKSDSTTTLKTAP